MADIRRLPRRLPVGTRYVLEGVPAESGRMRVISRLVVLPNGQQFDLTHDVRETTIREPARRRTARRATARRPKP
jgi:hypothetical protein